MAVSISLYNHTAKLFADGSNLVSDQYHLALYTAATFDATDTTLAGVTKTEAVGGTYTTGGKLLTNVSVSTVTTNDAVFDADDVTWNGPLTASYGIIYNQTDTDDPPLAFIDFDGSQSAGTGTEFKVIWDANGIFSFTVA